ncbi:MAG TPA: monovalent cation/H+ antiporter complex subunit F [Pseudogracilibacillus sp.]|nr:monovalent cation/H+ antiporter complex subunit F [Pseudogracilibacillus sp.]
MTNIINFLDSTLHVITIICLFGIALSLILLIYRIIVGPSNPDRAMALDVIGVCLMAVAALTSILVITTKLTDVILLIGILSFIGTLALAKYIEMGVLIERDDD